MMAGQPPPVLCAGFANWDVVLGLDELPDTDLSSSLHSRTEKIGGSASNTALTMESLGTSTGLLARVGTDPYGKRITEILNRNDVDTFLKETEDPTNTVFCIAADGNDPQYLADLHGHAGINASDVPERSWDAVKHVHLTSFHPELAGELAETASAEGKTVSFNPTQDFDKQTFRKAVHASDLLIVNDTEYRFIIDRYDVPELIGDGKTIVRTHGSDGVTAITPDFTVGHDGFPVEAGEIVDPIGAGDSFVAALLSEWVDSPVSPHTTDDQTEDERAQEWVQLLATGNAAGARAVLQKGAPTEFSKHVLDEIVDGTSPTTVKS